MEEKIWSGALWVFQQSSVGSFWNCSQTSTPTSFCIPLSASLFCQACPFLFLPFPTPRWMLQPLGRCGAGWWTTCHGEGLSPGTLNRGVDSDSVGTNAACCSECVMLAPKEYFWLNGMCKDFPARGHSWGSHRSYSNNTRTPKGQEQVDAVVWG